MDTQVNPDENKIGRRMGSVARVNRKYLNSC
jgi:hypothetical protein